MVINKCFKSFLLIIKPPRDISFFHIMFCCQFPSMPYAKYTKNWVIFFGIVKPVKFLEPRSWTTAFFFQIDSFEKDNQDQGDIVLGCSRCFRLWIFLIYVYCSWGLNIGLNSLRRRRCFYSRQRRWFLGWQRSRAGPLEMICN